MYYHFSYTSGSNPYIAKTETERDRIIKKHETAGEIITELDTGYYLIDDKRIFNSKAYYIKVNLPVTENDYIDGCGESVFVLVDEKTKEAHDSNQNGGSYNGLLDNDSLYYKGLKHSVIIPFEMRGEYRPVVPYSWLIENYEINKEFFKGTPLYDYL